MKKSVEKVSTVEERYGALKAQIGKETYNRVTIEAQMPRGYYQSNHIASESNIRRWAIGIGDLNPRFLDSEYARTTKYGRLVAPPLFLQSVCFAGVGYMFNDEVAVARPFHSGSEWEFFQPVLEDDRLDYNGIRLIDVKAQESKFSGQMLVTTSLCQYRNQRGESVGMCKFFCHQSSSDQAAVSTGKYDDVAKPYRYSDEETRKIEEDRDKEEMRGSRPRYWEDVREGDPVGPVVIGPHTVMHSVGHFTAVWGAFPLGVGDRAFRVWAKMLGRGIMVHDPRINALVNGDLAHLDYDLGRALGTPGGYDNGGGRECLASILMTNWIGDDGFLWKYSIQFRRFVVHGDTNWFQGTVTKKYVDDGKYCVDIDHWADNQRGDKTTVGKATVILPSKVAGAVKYPTPLSLEDVFPARK
jgi:acyl dehydratase